MTELYENAKGRVINESYISSRVYPTTASTFLEKLTWLKLPEDKRTDQPHSLFRTSYPCQNSTLLLAQNQYMGKPNPHLKELQSKYAYDSIGFHQRVLSIHQA